MNFYCYKIIRFITELGNNNNNSNNRCKLISNKKYNFKNVKILINTNNNQWMMMKPNE